MATCPFFNRCGGCKFDFADENYREKKLGTLRGISPTDNPVWTAPGGRRRADFCFAVGEFGMFERGSKNIVPVRNCPNLDADINNILPALATLPMPGAGSCLVTKCDNGIDICINSNVPHFDAAFARAAAHLPAIRVTWNGRVVHQTQTPIISFDGNSVEYPPNAFLQPSVAGESALRTLVIDAARGARRVADLFCGLGNFTFSLNARGFDIFGTGIARDLFRNPLTPGMLREYECVVMDPPRAGADAQCRELIKSDVACVIYVSCNPDTFRRDAATLIRGGYKIIKLVPVDQFVGSAHWEIFAVFEK